MRGEYSPRFLTSSLLALNSQPLTLNLSSAVQVYAAAEKQSRMLSSLRRSLDQA
jgi:hypothetical protein